MSASLDLPSLLIAAGPAQRAPYGIAVPVLAGNPLDRLHDFAPETSADDSAADSVGWRTGLVVRPIGGDLSRAALDAYAEVFEQIGPLRAVRIWNYVPAINAAGPEGLENYQAFCRGRSLAFEHRFGPAFHPHVPAASAVGTLDSRLVVAFVASDAAVAHRENPRQVPAYQYPREYGPRPPTFARATLVDTPTGRTVFIAGTSAIVGHQTVAPDNTVEQLRCTVDNLRRLGEACGLGPELGGAESVRHFRVYLRHAEDYPASDAALRRLVLRPTDRVTYLHADICRRPLNIEIEASVSHRTPHAHGLSS
jgi:hypothetical protein